MKSLAVIMALAVIWTASAQQFDNAIPLSAAFGNISTNLTVNSTNAVTNLTSVATIQVDAAVYHTFQLTATNAFAYAIDRSLDNTNWILGVTNSIAANGVTDTNFVAKEKYYRIRINGTNLVGSVKYLGGR